MLKMREEVFFNIIQFKIDLIQFVITIFAEPKQSILETFASSFSFNNQTYGTFGTGGRMRGSRGMQIHISGTQLHFLTLAINLNSHSYGSLQLVKQLFGLVIMIVFSGIGTANDHYDIILRFYIKIFISNGRFQ